MKFDRRQFLKILPDSVYFKLIRKLTKYQKL